MLQSREFLYYIIGNIFFRLFFFHAGHTDVYGPHTVALLTRYCKTGRSSALLYFLIHGLLKPKPQRNHNYDRGSPDHHAEHCEKSTKLAPLKAARAHPQ